VGTTENLNAWRFSLWSKLKFHMITRRIKPSYIEFERLKVYYCFYLLEREREREISFLDWKMLRLRERERERGAGYITENSKKTNDRYINWKTENLVFSCVDWFRFLKRRRLIWPDLLFFSSLINHTTQFT
jgi:hypothetical protein